MNKDKILFRCLAKKLKDYFRLTGGVNSRFINTCYLAGNDLPIMFAEALCLCWLNSPKT